MKERWVAKHGNGLTIKERWVAKWVAKHDKRLTMKERWVAK